MGDNLITTEAAAAMVGIEAGTLAIWRRRCTSEQDDRFIPYVRIGRTIRYQPEAVRLFIEARVEGEG